MVVKSLMAKLRNKFNVAVAEVGEQDIHQTIVIGVVAIVAHNAQADSVMEEIREFVEESTEAEILDIETEHYSPSRQRNPYHT